LVEARPDRVIIALALPTVVATSGEADKLLEVVEQQHEVWQSDVEQQRLT
jgi:hypothetical protein